MSPQFVDYDGDGRIDILAGSFGGAPYIARGGERGWAQPVLIRDARGDRLALNMYWDHDLDHWVWTKASDAADATPPEGQGTSVFALDWDADGDLDLLLGDYKTGRIYRRANEGKPGEPRLASVNEPVLAGDAPLEVPGRIETLRAIDWDADGLLDLLVGSVGDKNTAGRGGAVYLYRNCGTRGAPRFGAPTVLVERGVADAQSPMRPDEGLYPEAADVDGDGDLDLIVGGLSLWEVAARELSDAETTRAAALNAELATVRAASRAIRDEAEAATKDLDKHEAKRKREELLAKHSGELRALAARRTALEIELDPLTPGSKERHFVWLYRNTSR